MPFDASHLWFGGRIYGHLSGKKSITGEVKTPDKHCTEKVRSNNRHEPEKSAFLLYTQAVKQSFLRFFTGFSDLNFLFASG